MPRDTPQPFIVCAAARGPAKIAAEEHDEGGKPKLGTFSGNAYTGALMQPQGWWGKIICDLDGIQVPNQHRPVLRQHDHEQIVGHTTGVKIDKDGVQIEGVLSGQAEHVAKVAEPAKNGFQWQLSIGADPIRTEFLESGQTVTVNGREVTGPITISRETRLGEISFVPLGADGDTSAVVSATRGKATMFKTMLATLRKNGHVKAAKYSDEEIDKMSEDDAKANFKKCMAEDGDEDEEKKKEEAKAKAKAADDEKDEEKKAEARRQTRIAADRKADADEARRITEIKARCQKFAGVNRVKLEDGKEVDLIPHAIEAGWSADHTELIARRADRPGAGVGGPHLHFGTTPGMTDAVLECAVFDALPDFKLFDADFYEKGPDGHRRVSAAVQRKTMAELTARYTDQVRQAAHTHFKGRIGLQQLLTTLAAANGYRGPATFNDPGGWGEVAEYLNPRGFRADGPSTINTPATLSNVQNKFVQQGYMFTEQSWAEFCQVLPVKDLKPTKSVQLFGDFVFKELNTSGEMQHGSVGDNPYANQAALQARMITLPMQYLINDDLNMFGQVPMMLGRGWGLRINDLVYTKLLSPGNDEGGSTAFFAATHTIAGQSGNSNYSSGAGSALNSAGLQAAKQLFDKQVDPAGQPLGVDAEILLYPPELDVAAIELMNAQFIVMAGLASTAAASKQPNTNIWKGRFKPVMSRYLSNANYSGYSATAHYLFANPSVLPVIQLAALNGQVTPTIQTAGQDWQFNMLGISMRGWGGIGVSMQNFRGGVKSAGS
jgi:hypothetical protein